MTESKKDIQLIFRRQDFEAIYFQDSQGNIFWSKAVKQYFIILLVFATALIISFTYSFITNLLWGLPIFFIILFAIALINYATNVSPIVKWKKQVFKYLDDLGKIKSHQISLTSEALTMIQDDEVTITKWVTFTKAILNDKSITLSGNDTYFFPKKFMDINDYEYLYEFISDKIKNRL